MHATSGFGYPFALILPPEVILSAMRVRGVSFRKRLFDPATTLYAWMGQIAGQDRSCRDAVSRVVAYHAAAGRSVSARTGAYVQARQRLDLGALRHLSRSLARGLEEEHRARWPLGRPAFAVDGTALSGPDTPSLQKRFPQHGETAEGLGFPILRVVIVVSLTTGAIVDLAVTPHKGAGASEHAAFRAMWGNLRAGDLLVGDRLYYTYWGFHVLSRHGIDVLCRKSETLKTLGRPVLRVLGREDWVFEIPKPMRPRWMTRRMFGTVPQEMPVRSTSGWYDAGDGRTEKLELVSTLTGSPPVGAAALMDLYRTRWNVEVDIRSLKTDLGADILRTKTAGSLLKELWVTALAYNAVRAVMGRAAARAGVAPRSLSFKGALQTIAAFAPRLDRTIGPEHDAAVLQMLTAVASHVVGDRPGRVEPRLVKRRRKPIALMTVPRDEARALCRGGRYD